MNFFNSHLMSYLVPKNLNSNWNFGFILGMLLTFQIMTGLLLACLFVSDLETSFNSIRSALLDSNFGWYLRYYHSVGVSLYFFVMFLHVLKGLWFSSKYLPWSWYTGVAMLLLSIAIAFMGYVLPNGQMSFWGSTVISNLLEWLGAGKIVIFGEYTVGPKTLKRFYVLHFALPFVVYAIVAVHLYYLHRNSSTNPISEAIAYVAARFLPAIMLSDLRMLATILVLIGFQIGYGCIGIFQADPDNSIEANNMVTPLHIIPEWYLLLFYATLKLFPTKLAGLVSMAVVLELLVLLVEARAFTSVVSCVHYHRVWTIASLVVVPAIIMLGFIGKMAANFALISLGLHLIFVSSSTILKLLDSSRIRH